MPLRLICVNGHQVDRPIRETIDTTNTQVHVKDQNTDPILSFNLLDLRELVAEDNEVIEYPTIDD